MRVNGTFCLQAGRMTGAWPGTGCSMRAAELRGSPGTGQRRGPGLAWREPVPCGELEGCPRQWRGEPGSLGTGHPAVAQPHCQCLLLSGRQLGVSGPVAHPRVHRESSVRLALLVAELSFGRKPR